MGRHFTKEEKYTAVKRYLDSEPAQKYIRKSEYLKALFTVG